MKIQIDKLNKAFESRIRLGIMSVLMVNDTIDFNAMKEVLQTTDGNLASHIAALEKAEFIAIKKSFVGKKPNTNFAATKLGKAAFKQHIDALEKLLKQTK
ncbi:MAG: hypothetical protein RI955_1587 [Bacteroidota bacterium]|jgi:DNA-binding MarR family transcriptional regulator